MPSRSESVEEYLEAIYKLSRATGEVAVRDLADDLGVARPSVSEMSLRLEREGLVERGAGGAVRLTRDGESEASTLVRRHRLSERFLVDVLDLPWDQVHDEACRLEHALSPEVEARLAEQLGNPETCPHGHPIPDAEGNVVESCTVALSEIEPGHTATIARIGDERSDLLRYLSSLGMLPQTEVVVEGQAPFGGPLLVRVGEAQYALGREVADTIFVVS
jgi:DtxR family transcriptional regulator, Mn-dependent transcriptional regulator